MTNCVHVMTFSRSSFHLRTEPQSVVGHTGGKKSFYSDRKDQQMWKHFPCSLPNFEGCKGAIFSVLLLVHILDILMLPSHASSSF